jgi:formate dehydrogenase subunit beta
MKEISKKVKEIASRLLSEGQVDVFLAWEKGNQDYLTRPLVVRSAEEAERIVFDEYSIHNLSNYLLKFRDGNEKVGLVVKGCDSRGLH